MVICSTMHYTYCLIGMGYDNREIIKIILKKITHPDVVRAIISRFGALVGYHSLTLWYRTSFLKIISDR